MGLLYLMGQSQPNPRSLFASNEPGLALDIGDRYGASEAKRTWRRNLLTYTDYSSASAHSGSNVTSVTGVDFGPLGETSGIYFEDNSVVRYVYKTLSGYADVLVTLSVYIKMDDGLAPVIGTTAVTGDFCLSIKSGIAIDNLNVEQIEGDVYRVSATRTLSSGTNVGILKYSSQSARGFTVTGIQAEVNAGSTPSEYQPITDFNTEFKAAYPTHSLYQDANGVTPAVSPGDVVGLVIDSSKGGLANLGPELVTNGGFDADLSWWSTVGDVDWDAGTALKSTGIDRGELLTPAGTVEPLKWYLITVNVIETLSLIHI